MTKPLSVFYMCEPGRLEWQSVLLSASLREFCRDDFSVSAYCSASRFAQLDPQTLAYHETAGIEIIPIEPEAVFARANTPGLYQRNKIVACAHKRDSDYSVFMDTDTLLVTPVSFQPLFSPDSILALPAYRAETRGGYVDDVVWEQLYRKFDVPMPEARLKKKVGGQVIWHLPYFNAGVILFPEKAAARNSASLGETWLRIATEVDIDDRIPEQRGFLDQTTLPIAISKAGFMARPLERGFNQALPQTGRLPTEASENAKVLHYHVGENLLNYSDLDAVDQMLRKHTPYRSCSELVESFGRIGVEPRRAALRKRATPSPASVPR